MVGLFDSIAKGNMAAMCGYVDEDVLCPYGTWALTGTWRLGEVTRSGAQALVTVVSKELCLDSSGGDMCLSNTDPDAGQPITPANYDSALAAMFNPNISPAVPVALVNGRWLVQTGGNNQL